MSQQMQKREKAERQKIQLKQDKEHIEKTITKTIRRRRKESKNIVKIERRIEYEHKD